MQQPSPEQQIQYNADLVVQIMHEQLGVTLAYDERAVAWLDAYIEQQRLTLASETIDHLVDRFGAFLGECVRRQFGGAWGQINGQWAIVFDAQNGVFPFAKVRKQFIHGSSDSIESFYKFGMMSRTERNFWLDMTIFVSLLITTITGSILWLVIPHTLDSVFLGFVRTVWLAVHVYSGTVGLVVIVMHIVWHWGWLKALRGRPLSGMPNKLRANRIVDRIMWITYIAANVFGAIAWALDFGDDIYAVSVPDRLHVVSGVAWIILTIAHLALHGKWITSTFQRYVVPGSSRSSQIQ